jgi:alpha-mannosidase
LGKHSFEFAAMPFEGAWIEDGNFLQAQQFDLPLIATDIQAGKPLEQDPQMFRVEPEQLVVSAIKRAEDENALVVRFFNISSQALEGKVWVPFEVSRAYEVNLLEEEGEPLEVDSSEIRFSVRGAEIKTLKIYLASSETM